ncbi:hypothetical protein [Thauera sp. Sel9]|uniref:hypothetical protein n=1 Tax=Thauera sp. Sel9 TaxID=2974299 RepID=UPI0021E13775|nr:hypothetical protein [Thauera sp. Sel9]MCV2218883.1 hypothetical protein [Thauera sp. Sel9]
MKALIEVAARDSIFDAALADHRPSPHALGVDLGVGIRRTASNPFQDKAATIFFDSW